METTKKHTKLDNFKGKQGIRNFKAKGQPKPEAKSAGWAKKRKGMELAKAVLELAFKGAKDSGIRAAASEYFGVPEKDLTVEMMLLFRQAEKAIQKADTAAFEAVMKRAHGLPKQDIEFSGELKQTTVNVIKLPDGTEVII